MKPTRPDKRPDGLTMIELLVVLACLCLLVGLLIPALSKSSRTQMPVCVRNLMQVTLGQMVWANDHRSTNLPVGDEGFSKLLSSGGIASYYKALSNELVSPKSLTCPSDSRKPTSDFHSLTTNHLSYFLNLDATSGIDASTALNGDRHITFTPAPHGQIATLTTNLSVQWTKELGHGVMGNISFMDGSVQETINRDLATTLLSPSNTVPQRLLFP